MKKWVTINSTRGRYKIGKTEHVHGDVFEVDTKDKRHDDALKMRLLRTTDAPKEKAKKED